MNPWPVPDDFYNGVRAIQSFSPNGNVFFDDGAVLSKMHKEEASTYKIEGLPERMGFSAKLLLSVEHAFKKAHFAPEANKVVFFGENLRGVLMGLDLGSEATYNASDSYEDNVPI